jgi:hypothetical protein
MVRRLTFAVAAVLMAVPGSRSAAAAPPLRAVPDQPVFFAYTRLVCLSDTKGVVSCYRRGKTGGAASGTDEIKLENGFVFVDAVGRDGHLVAVYSRVLAGLSGAPGWLIALPGQLVRIGTASCVERVGRKGRVVACRHGSASSERAEIDNAGHVSVVSSGRTTWSSQDRNPVARPGQKFELVSPTGTIACQVLLKRYEIVACDREGPKAQTDGSLSFFAFTGGTIVMLARESGWLVPRRSFGPKQPTPAGRASSDVQPNITFLGKGGGFRVGSSRLACVAYGTPAVIGCGLTDAQGFGVPDTYSAVMHRDGSISIYRYDKKRKAQLVP